MTKGIMRRVFALAGAVLFSASAYAAGGGNVQSAGNDLTDRASLQRGAQLYMSYCAGCHSLKYLRYSRIAEDLGLSEGEVMQNLNFSGGKIGDQIHTSLDPDQAAKWFGKMPPDLSLIARVRGSDWVYTYLKSFYLDESRPLGWNNTLFPNASMPNPFWEMQGMQHAEYGKADPGAERPVTGLKIAAPGNVSPQQYDRAVRDVTNFIEYAGEPAALKRTGMGVWVLLFLAALTFLAYLLKQEYWRDVH